MFSNMLTVFVSFNFAQKSVHDGLRSDSHTFISAFNEIHYILLQWKMGSLSTADNTLLLLISVARNPDHDYFSSCKSIPSTQKYFRV